MSQAQSAWNVENEDSAGDSAMLNAIDRPSKLRTEKSLLGLGH